MAMGDNDLINDFCGDQILPSANRMDEYVFTVEYASSRNFEYAKSLQCKQKRADTEFPLTDTWGAERTEHARFIYNATARERALLYYLTD